MNHALCSNSNGLPDGGRRRGGCKIKNKNLQDQRDRANCALNPDLAWCDTYQVPIDTPQDLAGPVYHIEAWCLTEETTCNDDGGPPADLTWVSQFSVADMEIDTSGSTVGWMANKGTVFFSATDLDGEVVGTLETEWSRIGNRLFAKTPLAIEDWLEDLDSADTSMVDATFGIEWVPQPGLNELRIQAKYLGAVFHSSSNSHFDCSGVNGGLVGATAIACGGNMDP